MPRRPLTSGTRHLRGCPHLHCLTGSLVFEIRREREKKKGTKEKLEKSTQKKNQCHQTKPVRPPSSPTSSFPYIPATSLEVVNILSF